MSFVEPLPGFREFYPDQCRVRNYVFDIWRRVCRAHNFQEYVVPTLQPTDLFVEKSGPEIVGQLFNFVDKGEREVTLPPEVTPYACQMVGKKAASLKRPLRWFSIPECFRYERAQKGRTRSFYQLNADVFDDASTAAEVELISLTIDIFRAFGLTAADIVVRLSDRTLWVEFLKGMGVPAERILDVLGVIDKWEREDKSEIVKKLADIVGPGKVEALRDGISGLMECSNPDFLDQFLRKQLSGKSLETAFERVILMRSILKDLESMGLGDFVRIDFRIVRGLAYYTGFVYEVFDSAQKSRALAGGGRYDHLVEKLGGPSMPAMGMGAGDVTLVDLLIEKKLMPGFIDSIDFYIGYTSEATRTIALRKAAELRDAGFVVEIPLHDTGFGKQMKSANKMGATAMIIIGDDEAANGMATVKDFATGAQRQIPLEGLARNLRA